MSSWLYSSNTRTESNKEQSPVMSVEELFVRVMSVCSHICDMNKSNTWSKHQSGFKFDGDVHLDTCVDTCFLVGCGRHNLVSHHLRALVSHHEQVMLPGKKTWQIKQSH